MHKTPWAPGIGPAIVVFLLWAFAWHTKPHTPPPESGCVSTHIHYGCPNEPPHAKETKYYMEPHDEQVKWAKRVCSERPDICEWAKWLSNLTRDQFAEMVKKGQVTFP